MVLIVGGALTTLFAKIVHMVTGVQLAMVAVHVSFKQYVREREKLLYYHRVA